MKKSEQTNNKYALNDCKKQNRLGAGEVLQRNRKRAGNKRAAVVTRVQGMRKNKSATTNDVR